MSRFLLAHAHELFWIAVVAVALIAIPKPLFWGVILSGVIGLCLITSAILNRKDNSAR